jgi:hypothetical protein
METAHREALLKQFGGDPTFQGITRGPRPGREVKKTMERLGIQMPLTVDENRHVEVGVRVDVRQEQRMRDLAGASRQVHILSPLKQGLKQWLHHVAHSSQ